VDVFLKHGVNSAWSGSRDLRPKFRYLVNIFGTAEL